MPLAQQIESLHQEVCVCVCGVWDLTVGLRCVLDRDAGMRDPACPVLRRPDCQSGCLLSPATWATCLHCG